MLGNIELRPDEVSVVDTYGFLPGSRASEDGVLTNCGLSYNTPADRQAQSEVEAAKQQRQPKNKPSALPAISSDDRWPHKMTLAVNSFASADAAKAMFNSKKQRVAQPFRDSKPVVKDVTGLGDGAFSLHTEHSLSSLLNGEPSQTVTTEDSYTILTGTDVITVNLTQKESQKSYVTAPLQPQAEYFTQTYSLIKDTLAANR
jgi:hypothetical protein